MLQIIKCYKMAFDVPFANMRTVLSVSLNCACLMEGEGEEEGEGSRHSAVTW